MRYYGADLRDFYTGRMSMRRLSVLVSQLPPEAATNRSILGREAAAWSTADHLLAAAVDALNVANWQRTEDGQKGRNAPKPLRRPTDPPPPSIGRTSRSRREVRALLAKNAGRPSL